MPIDVAAIEAEVLAGLPNEAEARDDRIKNAQYYEGQFPEIAAKEIPFNVPEESIRESLLMRRVVQILTANLYRTGPARSVPGQARATAWLERVYRKNNLDALLQEADRLSMVNQVAAFEVFANAGDDAAERPIGVNLWGGEDLVVWPDGDDAARPGAVAVLDRFDHRRRLRLWTKDERRTYLTDKLGPNQTAGGTAYRRADELGGPNPYGTLPFAFVHANMPTREFWSGGPGDHLRKLNYGLNCRFTRSADDVRVNRPLPVLENAPPGFTLPMDRKPGQWIPINSNPDAAGMGAGDVRFSYATCDLGYLEGDWSDLTTHLEHALEMVGVPYSALRMEQQQVASGIALIAEQIPLVEWAMERQRPFGGYERNLARLVFQVAAALARIRKRPILGLAAEALLAASVEDLVLRWPEMSVELPGPTRDQSDGWKMDRGLMTRIDWLMKREGLTREEARQRLKQMAEDQAYEDALFGPEPTPPPPPPPPPPQPQDNPDGQEA